MAQWKRKKKNIQKSAYIKRWETILDLKKEFCSFLCG